MSAASILLAVAAWTAPSTAAAAPQDAVTAAVYAEPASAQVGEAVDCVVAVEHPAHAVVEIERASPLPDEPGVSAPSWIALGDRRVSRFSVDGQPDRARTLFKWSITSLEAGERALVPLKVRVRHDGQTVEIETEPLTLSVASALDPGEDAPRAQKGFRPPPEAGARSALWLGAAIVTLALVAGWWLRRRRARKTRAIAAPPSALELLAALEARAKAAPETAREITYDVSKLLRHAVDLHLAESHASLPDPVWLARVEPDERVPLGVRTALVRMLRDAERVKYALETPTRFALEESLKDARAVLEALASAPRPVKEAA